MTEAVLKKVSIEDTILSLKEDRDEPFCAYLYNLNTLHTHVSRMIASLPSNCQLYYAVKANSNIRILEELAPVVKGFEAASIGEIEKVRSVNNTIPILFGGPAKKDSEIAGAINYGVQFIHVESVHELRRVNEIACQHGVMIRILLRVNLRHSVPNARLKMTGVPTQFGIDEKEIPVVIKLCQELTNVSLKGFHFHGMSNNLDAKEHVMYVSHCMNKAEAWEKEFNLSLSYINAGGGIGVNYDYVEKQFDWDDFIARLHELLNNPNHVKWNVVFECGRYITASCGYYAAEIVDMKQNHGKHFVILRGGSHHFRLPAAWKHNHPFTVVPVEKWRYPFERTELENTSITVAGELCTPNDVLARDVVVPKVRIGDILLFHYTGAYGWDISHQQFLSHPNPEHFFL
ncbi:type III PLP-dependent enzyme [Bacillus taeanensis]|uniref:Siderophore biosynthesis PLP-dependent protein n=1 Tax=Bacillus taeanensis TaxID=273032 RepID=A0A366XUD8_9BACI|nr:type III PLP-dependent enzyme [Bacillus taeanensis]RBW68765.1 siderophore biosynthesis PLP-dependent protein [Bacillus taeanensis]